MSIPLKEFMAKSLANPDVKREYDALEQEFAIAAELIRARVPASHKPNWPSAWAPANPPSPASKAAVPSPAPKR